MTHGDIKFLKAVGIDPCNLGDPSPDPLPPQPPTDPAIPKLTAEDARWLLNLGVMWEHEVEPEFVPPQTLAEYLTRFPTGVRQAVGEVAADMELALPDGGLDRLAHDIEKMFLDFLSEGLEDVVELYEFHRSLCPGECGDFHDYMKFRVRACLPVALENGISDANSFGESR